MKYFLLWRHQCCVFPLPVPFPPPHAPCSCLVDSDAKLSSTQAI